MRTDASVVLLGEDVAEAGGPFKTSDGLLEECGPLRVGDTLISEMGFLGAGVGAPATGLRPVVEIMFIEFQGVALDQFGAPPLPSLQRSLTVRKWTRCMTK